MLYKWKKELFEGAVEIFKRKHKKGTKQEDFRKKVLEKKLRKKDSLIAEILEENIQLKKNTNGEI